MVPTEPPEAKPTSATSGRYGSSSSASGGLSESLASRLRARLEGHGSTLYAQTWKVQVTPSGRSLPTLRASVRRISGTGSTGVLNGWPTAAAHNAVNGKTAEQVIAMRKRTGAGVSNLNEVASLVPQTGWRSPSHREKGGGEYADPKKAIARIASGHQVNLQDEVRLAPAGWAAPNARDYRHPNASTYAERGGGKKDEQLPNQVAHALPGASPRGTSSTGLPAGTDGTGPSPKVLLNKRFSAWLMGYPPVWSNLHPTGTRTRSASAGLAIRVRSAVSETP